MTIRGTEGTGEFERYTPSKYIAAAREVLGEIDLDPASCEQAQRIVKARRFLSMTIRDNALYRSRPWHGRVWLNPPYHRELGPAFIAKLLVEFEAGRTTEAILLMNNSTDTDWFDSVSRVAPSYSDGTRDTRPIAEVTALPHECGLRYLEAEPLGTRPRNNGDNRSTWPLIWRSIPHWTNGMIAALSTQHASPPTSPHRNLAVTKG